MKDEIKEILNQLEIVARKHTIELCEDCSKIETMSASVVDELRLNNYSSKLLLDYITNLQEEKDKFKLRCYKALKLIRDNYGLLDKYGIDMIDDILNGGDDNE